MTTRNRTLEVFKLLSGHYEVVVRDTDRGNVGLKFWLCKSLSDAQIPMDGVRFFARLGDKLYDFLPERLDVSHNRLGMRIKLDAIPEGWVGECEIVFAQVYRCFPFKGIVDISDALLPARVNRMSADPPQEAASP